MNIDDLYDFDWEQTELCKDVQTAWEFFDEGFSSLVDKHAPFRRYKVKGRDSPWFIPDLSDFLRNRNLAWTTARKTEADWLTFRQLRNRLTFLIIKAKSDFYLSATTENLNDPAKFWKVVKSISANENHTDIAPSIVYNDTTVSDRAFMID